MLEKRGEYCVVPNGSREVPGGNRINILTIDDKLLDNVNVLQKKWYCLI